MAGEVESSSAREAAAEKVLKKTAKMRSRNVSAIVDMTLFCGDLQAGSHRYQGLPWGLSLGG